MEVKFGTGKIEYRLPNVIEAMKLLGKAGFSGNGTTGDRTDLEVMAELIEKLEPFIVKVDAKIGDKTIDTWEKALECVEIMEPASEISSKIMEQVSGGVDKKVKKRSK